MRKEIVREKENSKRKEKEGNVIPLRVKYEP